MQQNCHANKFMNSNNVQPLCAGRQAPKPVRPQVPMVGPTSRLQCGDSTKTYVQIHPGREALLGETDNHPPGTPRENRKKGGGEKKAQGKRKRFQAGVEKEGKQAEKNLEKIREEVRVKGKKMEEDTEFARQLARVKRIHEL